MKNGIQEGKNLSYTNGTGSAIASGAAVVLGTTIGVALVDIAVSAVGTVAVEGVVQLAAVNDAAFVQNDLLLWDTSTSKLTKTASATTKVAGWAHEAKAETGTTALVKLIGNAPPVAAAVAGLTDSSGGTANGTVQAIGGTYSQTEIANNFADVTAKVNAILTNLKAVGLMAS